MWGIGHYRPGFNYLDLQRTPMAYKAFTCRKASILGSFGCRGTPNLDASTDARPIGLLPGAGTF